MPSEPIPREEGVQRLHPSSLLFTIGAQAKSLLLPGLIVLFLATRGGRGELWFMLLFIPAVIATLFHYWSYRYRFDPDELMVREGVIFRNERHIPYSRIQNIDLVQNPLHRLLDVAEVRLETAGGQKPEAVMRVLSLDAVDRMRDRVFAGRSQASATSEHAGPRAEGTDRTGAQGHSEGVPYSMTPRDLLLFGLISNRGMVVVAAVLGLAWQVDLFDRWVQSLSRESLERYTHVLPSGHPVLAALLALGALILVLILMRVLSVLWAFAKFQGFRLTRRGDDLRAEYGLLPHVSKTIPRHRIQVLSTSEGFLHRACGCLAVRVETAGSANEQQGSSTGRLWLAPLIRKERFVEILGEALPHVGVDDLSWESISSRAPKRMFRVALYVAAIITALGVWGVGPWGLAAPLALVPLAWVNAQLRFLHTRYALAPGAVYFRSGWWIRRMSVARFNKLQAVQLRESPFDRRHRMASLRVDTAGATRTAHSIDIPYLDADVASRLMARLYDEAGRTAFRW